ncbi:hypothetical protein ACS8FB_03810 [Psychrobacter sp. 1U1]|uniref:hypothetical protein n=1 Tax=Psychrobacter sp. 1U1 TaxID=3453576 RepID=UPI003F459FD9
MAVNEPKTTTRKLKTGTNNQVVKVTGPELRKFLVHFRRPIKSGYDGSYGFDWLRDEYVYDIENVFEKGDVKKRLYRGNINSLIKEYTRLKSSDANNLEEVDEIVTENKETYIPAWLSVFPTSNPINRDGVSLHLQIDQEIGDDITDLTIDGTVLKFETSFGVVVTPTQIDLGDVISKKSLSPRILTATDSSLKTKTVYYYKDEAVTINIKATDVYNKAGYVKVVAIKGNKKRHVGLLMLYPNSDIKKAEIQTINFCTTAGQNPVPTPENYKEFLEARSFNQALIKTQVNNEKHINIADLHNLYKIKSKAHTISDIEVIKNNAIKNFLADYKPEDMVYGSQSKALLEDIMALCQLFNLTDRSVGDEKFQKLSVSKKPKTTFIIFTDYIVKEEDGIVYGRADGKVIGSEEYPSVFYGDTIALFNKGNEDLYSLVHEVGHSFSLPHSFDEIFSDKHFFIEAILTI